MSHPFWTKLDALIKASAIVIDRPKGTPHPRYPDKVYPVDYGYLRATTAGDGQGIDLWRGSLGSESCASVVCTIDLLKRDSEIKLLIGCSEQEQRSILAFHDSQCMSTLLIRRDAPSRSVSIRADADPCMDDSRTDLHASRYDRAQGREDHHATEGF